MPAKSKEQMKLMYSAANKKDGIGGLTPGVAKKFIRETPKSKRSFFMKEKK